MASKNVAERAELERSATWPSPTMPTKPLENPTKTSAEAFKTDLEEHPERHFLSPMTAEECYGWDSDSEDDEDDEGGPWKAGIHDFSLFVTERKRALETGEPLDSKWDSMLASQAESFERSCERVLRDEQDRTPELTPDTSPNLRDNLEDDEVEARVPWITVPDFLTQEIRPGKLVFRPDEALPTALTSASASKNGKVQRPGLSHARTMSGRRHVWVRPGSDMPTVGEDVEAEKEAEAEAKGDVKGVEGNEEEPMFMLVVTQH